MIRLFATYENSEDLAFLTSMKAKGRAVTCAGNSCPPNTGCSDCFLNGWSGAVFIAPPINEDSTPLRTKVIQACKDASQCSNCPFFKNNDCELGYNCPADLTEE